MEEDGPGLVEYALVMVLVSIVVIVILSLIPQAVFVESPENVMWIPLGVVGVILLIIFGVGYFGGKKAKRKEGNKRGKTKNG